MMVQKLLLATVVIAATTASCDSHSMPTDSKPINSIHPKYKYPELWKELNKKLPYGGGNKNSKCGAWETIDKNEARQLAKKCPPLKWGDIR